MAIDVNRKCMGCNEPLLVGKNQCTLCGVWNMVPDTQATEEDDDPKPLFQPLSDAKPSDYERGLTQMIDVCLGGGIVFTSTVLLAGSAGGGKSTLSLHCANNLILSGEGFSPTLYIAAEEAVEDIKTRSDRIGITEQSHIYIVDALGGLPNMAGKPMQLVGECIFELLTQIEPGLVILDSLQGLCGKDYAAHELVCRAFKRYAKREECPAIILGHYTKDDDYAGEHTLAHAVDCVLTLTGDPKQPERVLRCPQKNRFGPTPVSQKFIHTETGLKPWHPSLSSVTA